jgi:formylmethanofuran dehydrogenase subunit E
MTPKEKAIELVSKYYGHFTAHMSIAKKCALIAVDEIIADYREDYESINKDIYTIYSWWQEVKQEIEKL